MSQALTTLAEVGTRRTGQHKGGIPQKWVLDAPGRQLILARYDGRTATIDELARRLGVPRYVVKRWGRELGLARQKEARWTPDEDSYLEEHLHRLSLAAIATHLGRTKNAVTLRAQRHLGISKGYEGYTLCGLCAALGCDHHKVERWLRAGWLRGTRRQSERTPQQGGDMWLFTDGAVRAFVREHPQEVDPRRADWVWLVDVLTGQGATY